ncbi:MAG: DUF423 domain-containing protein [Planctomycetota bacterium]
MTANWLFTGSLMAGLGVVAGAFGAHGLQKRVDADMIAVWKTAADYQIYHALALLAVAWAAERYATGMVQSAGWCFLAGIVVFSGSLYLLVLTGNKMLGAITPIGGVLFIAGWVLLALTALKTRN